ncbi:MAG TPA: right-handed parallel beta-helix repeat-containing protein [Chitinispirillaceae bacterium]|nr:right-handed parallel beta-helix repeat-containing protein [Chitinispirillaceae bacterium]
MFDKDNPDIIWISPDNADGEGTWDNPYGSISDAQRVVKPGDTIVLKEGIYRDNQTIEISGTPERPVRIVADSDAKVIIDESCWFFYDTSDLIVSNLVFKNAPYGAVSVIGHCKRNRFDSLQFLNCGTMKKASCTMYFGGSGGEFNVVENCRFEHGKQDHCEIQTAQNASIALMISEGDTDESTPLIDHIIRRNHFLNYGFAILIGTQDSTTNPYGHVIEYNTIKDCSSDGIIIKCGDIQVRANLLENCKSSSISIQAGVGSVIEDNRILNSNTGITINGFGHSVSNNCIIRCKDEAIRVCGKTNEQRTAASNLLIEKNTMIDCGTTGNLSTAFIRIEPGTTSIIQQNLFHGSRQPYQIIDSVLNHKAQICPAPAGKTETVINDNISSGECAILKGVISQSVKFDLDNTDCFENNSGYGASGWMLRPEGFDINADEPDNEVDYLEASILEDDEGNLVVPGENFNDNIFSRYYSEVLDLQNFNLEEYESNSPGI